VFLAMGICVVASIKFDSPLNWIGPNLSSSQLLVPTNASPGIGEPEPLSGAQIASLNARVNSFAASVNASVVTLEGVGSLYQTGTPRHSPQNFSGSVYVATPQLLAAFGSSRPVPRSPPRPPPPSACSARSSAWRAR
jgi:hypothetical protein